MLLQFLLYASDLDENIPLILAKTAFHDRVDQLNGLNEYLGVESRLE